MEMGEHEYGVVSHMLNVGVGCGMLCVELLGPDAPLLRDVLTGGLVHDIGKRDLPVSLLQKEGRLTDDEWSRLRIHPITGAELLARQGMPRSVVELVRDHHERPDGRGYPAGASGSQIGLPARMCAVVDIHASLAAARPHRPAVPTRRVLESMRAEAGTVIDRAAFEAWERIVEELIEQNPGRCVPDRAGAETPRLRAVIPSAPKQAIVRHDPSPSAQLTRERECDIAARVSGPAPEDAWIPGRLVAISASGTLRLVLQGAAPAGERIRVELEGRPPVQAVIRKRSFGPGGEPVLECALASSGQLRRAS